MATLTNNTNWEKTFTITASTGSIITLDTDNKFVEKDKINICTSKCYSCF